jgi:outer membrane protein TolC
LPRKARSWRGANLQLAQDRFQQGTANNVEVVTAQDELARAEENYILAVSSHVDAKFALARAMGDTEKNIVAVHGESIRARNGAETFDPEE